MRKILNIIIFVSLYSCSSNIDKQVDFKRKQDEMADSIILFKKQLLTNIEANKDNILFLDFYYGLDENEYKAILGKLQKEKTLVGESYNLYLNENGEFLTFNLFPNFEKGKLDNITLILDKENDPSVYTVANSINKFCEEHIKELKKTHIEYKQSVERCNKGKYVSNWNKKELPEETEYEPCEKSKCSICERETCYNNSILKVNNLLGKKYQRNDKVISPLLINVADNNYIRNSEFYNENKLVVFRTARLSFCIQMFNKNVYSKKLEDERELIINEKANEKEKQKMLLKKTVNSI